MIFSIRKYKYSKWSIVPALLMFPAPPLILILQSYCEKKVLKKSEKKEDEIKGKANHKISIAIFIFYYLLGFILAGALHVCDANDEWYSEIALVCTNFVMTLFIPLYLYAKKQVRYLIDFSKSKN
ncbi:hypothetical protein LJB95_02145 [Paludibacteraceae bacterium OttesenSCG-928-F17]|nr:hypothetical protein [Paludibacteraceae bacterium OttesenSCG-928-F17]